MSTPNFAALPTRKWPTEYRVDADGEEYPEVDTFQWTEEQRAQLRPGVLVRYYDNAALWVAGTAYRDEQGVWCVDAYEAMPWDRPTADLFGSEAYAQDLSCVDPETITPPVDGCATGDGGEER